MSGTTMGADELRGWLVDWVAAALGATDVDVDAPLDELGLASRDAVALAGDLEDLLERTVSPTLAWEVPSLRALATRLTGDARVVESAPAVTSPVGEPIAVVGLGCRLPGDVDGPESFWRLLLDGRDVITDVPAGRWERSGVEDPSGLVNRRGGFLADVEGFDADFFGLTPTEVELMDPQQRLLLEVTVEALLHARLDPAALRGSDTGVFVGISSSEYGHLTASRLEDVEPWTATGAALSIAANRISYALDLHGPSLAVDTACSSSLVAVHTAVANLRAGDCSVAAVGGVNLLLTPTVTASFDRAGALSPDGRCKPFGAGADGIGRAEGCGVVVLERLSDAQAAGHRVLAVITGSAVNSDGRSNGLTAPNPQAQQAVLTRAYANSGIDPTTIDYVEAHGTGTPLGDPIEAGALAAVLGTSRPADRPLLLGSVKSNLGHLEAAAGVAGLIKLVLALHHERLPATLHATERSPHIDFAGGRLELVDEARDWPRYGGPARAGLSGFGFGGTNAHVVLEQAPPAVPATGTSAHRVPVLAVGGRDDARLVAEARSLASWLRDADAPQDLAATARSLLVRHGGARARAAVAANSTTELADALDTVVAGPSADAPDRPVWIFAGYGQQWTGMGRLLMRDEPVFAAAVADVASALAPHTDVDVEDALRHGRELTGVAETMVSIFALQLGLAALWRAQGVEPAAVIGHSLGEVAAAVTCGVLGLGDAAEVMATRARLLERVAAEPGGAMAVVDLSRDELVDGATDWPDVEVAVATTRTQSTVTGPAEQIARLVSHAEGLGRDAWPLRVAGAGHSAAVESILPELRTALGHVQGRRPRIAWYGTVLDDPRAVPAADADYWAANTRRTVRLADAFEAAIADGHDTFVEISAHPLTARAVRAAAGGVRRAVVVASLARDTDDVLAFARGVAALHAAGHPRVLAAWAGEGRSVDLPRPAWLHRPFWFRSPVRPSSVMTSTAAPLGRPTELAGGSTWLWSHEQLVTALGRDVADARPGLIELTCLATDAARTALDDPTAAVIAASVEPAHAARPGRIALTCTRTDEGSVELDLLAEREGWLRIGRATAAVAPVPARAEPDAPEPDAPEPVVFGTLARLQRSLGEVMGLSGGEIDPDAPLVDLGLDSLMATRARHAVERDFGVPLPVRLLLQGLSLSGLAEHIDGHGSSAATPPAAPSPAAAPAVPPRDPVERFLAGLWAQVLETALGVTEPVTGRGADAVSASRVEDAVRARLGTSPSAETLLAAGTVERMADLVRPDFEGPDDAVVRVLRAGAPGRRPVFVFHPAGGPTSVYRPLIDQLTEDVPVFGLERLDECDTVETKAERYVELIRERAPSGPYRLLGWSLGGVLAMECAQRLRADGEILELLASIDTIRPRTDVEVDERALLMARYRRFADYVSSTYGATVVLPGDLADQDEQAQLITIGTALHEAGVQLPAGVLRHQYTSYVDARIAERWSPRPWAGELVLYRADEVEALTTELDPRYHRTDDSLGWDTTADVLTVVRVPGNHITMIDRPNVDVLAVDLSTRLAALDRTEVTAR